MRVCVEIDGAQVELETEPRMLLGQVLRDERDVPVRLDCETSTCGACTVLLDGAPVKSCAVLAVMSDGHAITTAQGLTDDSAVVRALDDDLFPCGECRDAVRLVVASAVRKDGRLDRSQVARALSGTICRCTGYQPILDAVESAQGPA